MKLKVKLKRDDCIMCQACVMAAPEDFEMADDGKSSLKGATENAGIMEKVIEDADEDRKSKLKQAESGCPVDIITVEEID